MSGLHTSINTHISNGFPLSGSKLDTINQTYFLEAVGNHKDRVKNLYFLFAVVVKAVVKMEPVLLNKNLATGLENDNSHLSKLLIRDLITQIDKQCEGEPFQDKKFFNNDKEGMQLLTEIQHKFYNISRIIDCVSCDKCRLNGKVQVRGLATVLKVLFVPDYNQAEMLNHLTNQEIVSVVQLLGKLSESLQILDKFRYKEQKDENYQWYGRNIFAFILAFMITMAIMLIFGWRPDTKASEMQEKKEQKLAKLKRLSDAKKQQKQAVKDD